MTLCLSLVKISLPLGNKKVLKFILKSRSVCSCFVPIASEMRSIKLIFNKIIHRYNCSKFIASRTKFVYHRIILTEKFYYRILLSSWFEALFGLSQHLQYLFRRCSLGCSRTPQATSLTQNPNPYKTLIQSSCPPRWSARSFNLKWNVSKLPHRNS